MSIVDYLQNQNNVVKNSKGLLAYQSTNSSLLDMFSSISSFSRASNSSKVTSLFANCLAEDKLLAFKLAFYIRDFRKLGQGERNLARKLYKFLATIEPKSFAKNIYLIPFYGRYDDLYALVGTPLEKEMFKYMYDTLINDLNSEYPSLLGKWLISANLKSTKFHLGVKTAKYFAYFSTNDEKMLGHLDSRKLNNICKDYRLLVTKLRKKIDILETKLCSKDYENIDFSKIPSKALMQYSSFFNNKLNEKYSEYLLNVEKNKVNINVKTLTPYEIIRKIRKNNSPDLELMWQNLPDYVNGSFDTLVVADTSGSMVGKPLDVALSLAIYFAEHNKGIWHNKMITFSAKPSFISFKGDSLYSKVCSIPCINENTNIESVFKLILNTAIQNKLAPDQLPKKVIIISDMQFDNCKTKKKDYFNYLKEKYSSNGYELPQLVFWDVSQNNYRGKYYVSYNTEGALLLSGINPNIFDSLMKSIEPNPLEYMQEVLNDPYFDQISI